MDFLLLAFCVILLYYVVKLDRAVASLKQERRSTISSIKQLKVAGSVPVKERARTVHTKQAISTIGRMGKLLPTRGGER